MRETKVKWFIDSMSINRKAWTWFAVKAASEFLMRVVPLFALAFGVCMVIHDGLKMWPALLAGTSLYALGQMRRNNGSTIYGLFHAARTATATEMSRRGNELIDAVKLRQRYGQ